MICQIIFLLLAVLALSKGQNIPCPLGLQCCSPVYDPANGHANICKAGWYCPVGTAVTYWCDWPTVIQGTNVVLCQQRSIFGPGWSALPPICIPDPYYCEKLPVVANAYPLACQASLCVRGTQVYVSCQPGFQPGLAQTITCVQSLGRSAWSATPSCVPQGSLALGGVSDIFSFLFGGGKAIGKK